MKKIFPALIDSRIVSSHTRIVTMHSNIERRVAAPGALVSVVTVIPLSVLPPLQRPASRPDALIRRLPPRAQPGPRSRPHCAVAGPQLPLVHFPHGTAPDVVDDLDDLRAFVGGQPRPAELGQFRLRQGPGRPRRGLHEHHETLAHLRAGNPEDGYVTHPRMRGHDPL